MPERRAVVVGKLKVETVCKGGELTVRIKVRSAQTKRWKTFLSIILSCQQKNEILKALKALAQEAPGHNERIDISLPFIHLDTVDTRKWTFVYDRGRDQIDWHDSFWRVKYENCPETRISYLNMRPIATLILTSYQACC